MKQTKKRIEKINKLLISRFGVPLRQAVPPNPVDMLVATILSQNTNDKNSYKAFTSLKKKYKNWTEVAHLTKEEIEKEISTLTSKELIEVTKPIKNIISNIKHIPDSLKKQYYMELNKCMKIQKDKYLDLANK